MDVCLLSDVFSVGMCCKDLLNTFKSESSSVLPKEWSHSSTGLFSITDKKSVDGLGSSEIENVKIKELEVALERIVKIKDERQPSHDLYSSQSKMVQTNKYESLLEDNHNHNTKKILERHLTFPCSKSELEGMSIMLMSRGSSLDLQNLGLSKSKNAAQPCSLPSASGLVSAMKGGRKQQGKPLISDLKVKWAPDVYDPPITLKSRTTKNPRRRSKLKDSSSTKHRYKGKSSRSSVAHKKHAYRSTTVIDSFLSMQASQEKILIDGFAQHDLGFLEDEPKFRSGVVSGCPASTLPTNGSHNNLSM